jgi:predicted nucleic-acid-binding protein
VGGLEIRKVRRKKGSSADPQKNVETVWVLESVYQCIRKEISQFLEVLIFTPVFTFVDSQVIRRATHEYKKGGDFSPNSILRALP